MAIIGVLPVTLQNGSTADAAQVMSDLNFIVNQVNANGLSTAFVAPGTLLSIQVFTSSGTYTPNAVATRAIVELVGGGGAGGGAGATNASQVSIGSGGNAGNYARGFIQGGLTSQAITIGAGGTGTTGAGNPGGTTSFGTIFQVNGGAGGVIGVPAAPPFQASQNAQNSASTGSGLFLVNNFGAPGSLGVALALTNIDGGIGGSGPFGTGGLGTAGGGGNALSFGGGGGGAGTLASGSAAIGGNGTKGMVLVYEYA